MIYYGLIIIGTDTGVGKTEVGCALAGIARARGLRVGVFKPVETGCRWENNRLIPQDGLKLLEASGAGLPLDLVVPYRFSLPASPYASARAEGKRIEFEKIYQIFDELAGEFDLILVEGAGGLLVPVNENFLFADLIRPMHLPVLVVAENRLGVINQTLLTVESARRRGLEVLGVLLNQTQPGEIPGSLENTRQIEEFSRVPVLAEIPFFPSQERSRGISQLLEGLFEQIFRQIKQAGKRSVLYYL